MGQVVSSAVLHTHIKQEPPSTRAQGLRVYLRYIGSKVWAQVGLGPDLCLFYWSDKLGQRSFSVMNSQKPRMDTPTMMPQQMETSKDSWTVAR